MVGSEASCLVSKHILHVKQEVSNRRSLSCLLNNQILPQVEQEEEFITNKLMKRLQQLKNEKQVLANEVEQEEEYLVNTLQKRLHKLNGEKVDLENQLEVEQEYIVNKLQKKVRCCS